MKLYREKKEHNCTINIASLIDVVFLLIIFFMVVSHITMSEAEPIDLPAAAQGKTETEKQNDGIIITIRNTGQTVIGSRETPTDKIKETIEKIAKSTPAANVIIRAHKDIEWQNVRNVMNDCAACGLKKVKVRVVEQ